jgi:putative ABC transport system substrate-binding protein
MRRRDFLTALGGAAAAWPLAARAQAPNQVRRIGALVATTESRLVSGKEAFLKELRQLGWSEGRNLRIDWRYADGDPVRFRSYATELVRLNPDVIFAVGTQVVAPLLQATRTIPIVFANVADPVSNGFVDSLSRPGANITGFVSTEDTISAKSLGLLKEIDPRISRILVLRDPLAPSAENRWLAIKAAEASFNLQLTEAYARDAGEIERAIDVFAREPNGGVVILPGIFRGMPYAALATVMANHHLPSIHFSREYVVDGGLLSYGVNQVDLSRRAATYVDRVLRGAMPADLPIQLPTKFELVLNIKAAKALGLEVPHEFLLIADEVIE